MSSILLNNYDDNYAETNINIATWHFEQLESGTVTDSEGMDWTLTVENDNEKYRATFFCSGHRYSIEDFLDVLPSMIDGMGGIIDSDIIHKTITPAESYGKGTSSNLQPYMTLYSSASPGDGSISFYFNSASHNYVSFDGGPCLINCPLGVTTDNEDWRYGNLAFGYAGGGFNSSKFVIVFVKGITDELWGVPDADPGQKGFRPTAARTRPDRPGVGGRGTTRKKDPDYASDTVTQPSRPNESKASAVKSGFLKAYLMTQAQLDKICSALYSDTLLDVIKSSFVNPLDFIVSLMVFPTDPDVGAIENLRFGKWLASAAAGVIDALGVDITGSRLTYEFKTINFGTIQIPENWGNFLDYSQTSIELYLPFIGSVNIDVAECMGGSINVQYTIDFFTGMCVANVLCQRSFPLPSGKLIPNRAQHAYQGNCAIQIPLSAADYGSMVGSLINACTQGISNPAAGFAGIATDAIAGGLRPNISSKGNIVANSGFCSVLYPYVRITRPITAEPDSYQEVMGYPSYVNTTLGQCEDLCICDEIDLKGVTGATEEELNRIRQLCKDGVYV